MSHSDPNQPRSPLDELHVPLDEKTGVEMDETDPPMVAGVLRATQFGSHFSGKYALHCERHLDDFVRNPGGSPLATITIDELRSLARTLDVDQAERVNQTTRARLIPVLQRHLPSQYIAICCGVVLIIRGLGAVLDYIDALEEHLGERTLYVPISREWEKEHAIALALPREQIVNHAQIVPVDQAMPAAEVLFLDDIGRVGRGSVSH